MHLALARKYRPQNFTEVVGQDAVVKTLRNALELNRLHHAYLFCGARGTGKTSMARILAKSINCEKGPTMTPCGTCVSCVGVTQASSLDVVEIDGASNNKVEEVREIREQVKYLPGGGKYKIYIIDEVHMLTKSAFNALLKTLEEPPAHVLFILATTEPHDIPITILSRCQRFDFRKLTKADLEAHLRRVLEAEGVRAEAGAVSVIADCAQGSVRDALSLLDQVIGACRQDLSESGVRAALGLGDRLLVKEAFRNLVEGNLPQALDALEKTDAAGADLKIFAEELLRSYRHLVLLMAARRMPGEVSPSEQDFFKELAGKSELSLVLAQCQVLFQGAQEVARSEFQKTSLEITFVKLAQLPGLLALPELVAELKERAEKRGNAGPSRPAAPVVAAPPPPASAPQVASGAPAPAAGVAGDWYALVQWIRKVKPPLGGFLGDAVPVAYSDQAIEIGFAPASASRQMAIERKSAVEDLLTQHFGRRIEFKISELPDEKKKP